MDLVTPAYRGASTLARLLPAGVVDAGAPQVAALTALLSADRRAMVERHQRRIDPGLAGPALRQRVRDVYRSYGRYYGDSFRLPGVSPAELDARLTYDGYEQVEAARSTGTGPVLLLPHLGSWEWGAFWMTRVRHIPVTAVVERIDPPALFDWFVEFREGIGLEIVPLGPEAGRSIVGAIRRARVVALLCDRDITGTGVEVDFFGEKTTLPSGPAVLALRTGAQLLPSAVYDRGRIHHGVVRPPVPVERRGTFRDDVARITQLIAYELEDLIRAAPEQWHLLQPNWPSDRAARRVRL
jgi:KDO2-lipid IV(A) lauroyltransferase